MNPCIISYMILTYAIKAIIFVFLFNYIQSEISENFLIMIIIFTLMFAGLDYIIVSFLPASGWKKNIRERLRVPENMQSVLALDYLIKAALFYYVYHPSDNSNVSYYGVSSNIIKFIIIFAISLCTDVILAFVLELGVSKEYSEQFCSMCSM